MSEREPIRDIAKNLERWVQGIVARVFAQESLDELAANANIPVINALSDKFHPCQALADFFTLQERYGDLRGSEARLRGRRQQHVPLADEYRRALWRARSRGNAQGLRAGCRQSSPNRSAWLAKRAAKSR